MHGLRIALTMCICVYGRALIKDWNFAMPSPISLSELGSDSKLTLVRFAVLQERKRSLLHVEMYGIVLSFVINF